MDLPIILVKTWVEIVLNDDLDFFDKTSAINNLKALGGTVKVFKLLGANDLEYSEDHILRVFDFLDM